MAHVRQVVRIGHSLGVTLPREQLDALGIEFGTPVEVSVSARDGGLLIRPLVPQGTVSPRFVDEARSFAERHRAVLEALARE